MIRSSRRSIWRMEIQRLATRLMRSMRSGLKVSSNPSRMPSSAAMSKKMASDCHKKISVGSDVMAISFHHGSGGWQKRYHKPGMLICFFRVHQNHEYGSAGLNRMPVSSGGAPLTDRRGGSTTLTA